MDHDANIVAVSQREFEQIYPKAGWVEHDPMEIWATQSSTLVEVLAKADIVPMKLQRSVLPTSVKPPSSGSVRPVNQSTTPLCGSVVVPQISAKSSKRDGMEEYIRNNTGRSLTRTSLAPR